MLEAKEVNKFKVTFTKVGSENLIFYFPNAQAVLDHIQNLNEAFTLDNSDTVQIEKLQAFDYMPSEFTNLDNKEENLWMGEFTHFHDLTNNQNARGILYAKRFICFMYNTREYDPKYRNPYYYTAHLFLPTVADDVITKEDNGEDSYLSYLKSINPVTLTIHATNDNFDDQGVVQHIVLPLADLYNEATANGKAKTTNAILEDIMDVHIKQFADMYNPYLYLKSLKNEE